MKIFLTLISVLLFAACNNNDSKDYLAMADNGDYAEMEISQEHPGKLLMENNCYTCHSPKAAEDNMAAPPMVAIKMHYISEDTSKEDFVNDMVEWSKNPSEEKSKMPGAIKKFGLMPYQFYPESTIRQIADYMFDTKIEEPVWFEEHYNKMHGEHSKMKGKMHRGKGMDMNQNNDTVKISTKDRGMQIAQTTQAELGKNLMGQVKKNGVIAALDFCNIEAMPITDSMATVHKAYIKRVTDKPRNPKNKANASELKHIDNFKKQVAAGGEVEPIVIERENVTEFYSPIVTNSMCLKCHGTPEKEMESLTLSKIVELYPEDKATGYTENEVRGIWSISFSR
ncbi:MAG: Tll0287-like domain-containing protein [Aequorivita sp.]